MIPTFEVIALTIDNILARGRASTRVVNVQISVHEYGTRDYDAGRARASMYWTDLLPREKTEEFMVM